MKEASGTLVWPGGPERWRKRRDSNLPANHLIYYANLSAAKYGPITDPSPYVGSAHARPRRRFIGLQVVLAYLSRLSRSTHRVAISFSPGYRPVCNVTVGVKCIQRVYAIPIAEPGSRGSSSYL